MNGERMCALVGRIRDEYVLEAEPDFLKALIPADVSPVIAGKRRTPRRLLVAAASVLLALGVGFGTLTALTRGGVIPAEAMPFLGRFPALQAFLWPDGEETDGEETDAEETTEGETAPICDHVLLPTEDSDPTVCFTGSATPMHCERCGDTVSYTPEAGAHLYREGFCTLCGLAEGAHPFFTVEADPDETAEGVPTGVMLTGLTGEWADTLRLPNVGYLEGYGILPVTAVGELSPSLLSHTPTEVILPDTVKRIGSKAFCSLATLKRVTLPEGLVSIGDEAFRGCGLLSLTLPDGVTALGESALRDCPSLRRVYLSASLKTIGDFALRGCPTLGYVSVPEENTVFYVKSGCLIKRSSGKLLLGVNGATIPESGICIIGEAAFEGREDLGAVRIPDTVRQIQDDAFRNCKGLTSFHFPEGSTLRLGSHILAGCSDMTRIFIACNIQTIGEDMFEDCTALEKVLILDDIVQWQKQCIRTGIDEQIPGLK